MRGISAVGARIASQELDAGLCFVNDFVKVRLLAQFSLFLNFTSLSQSICLCLCFSCHLFLALKYPWCVPGVCYLHLYNPAFPRVRRDCMYNLDFLVLNFCCFRATRVIHSEVQRKAESVVYKALHSNNVIILIPISYELFTAWLELFYIRYPA